jgi:hypothetical protein
MGDQRNFDFLVIGSGIAGLTFALKVARVAILFSDLTGSTALYSQVGDAAAFRLVDDHFDLLREVIDANRGVVVKTMGDAVMAAFDDPSDCVKAGVDALMRFEQFRAEHKYGDSIGIKLGMFAGACYVVTANGQLDYFGQTVNVASRIADFAQAGESIGRFGRLVGEYFAPVQGGVFADERMRRVAKALEARDIHGFGQSSWGPTLFVLCPDAELAGRLALDLANDPAGADCQFTIAAPLNRGARVEVTKTPDN